VFDFLLDEDPVYEIVKDKYDVVQAALTASRQTSFMQWSESPSNEVVLELQQRLSSYKKIDVSTDDVYKLLKGPPREVFEYNRITINGCTFVTHDHDGKGNTSRQHCFYVNAQQRKEFNSDDVAKDRIEYPIARIESIYSFNSTNVLSLAKHYTVLRIRALDYMHKSNFTINQKKTKQAKPSTLPHIHISEQDHQPIINAVTVKPYNIALWPADPFKHSNDWLAVWIAPHHGDTL
jgi:hypothetical protein